MGSPAPAGVVFGVSRFDWGPHCETTYFFQMESPAKLLVVCPCGTNVPEVFISNSHLNVYCNACKKSVIIVKLNNAALKAAFTLSCSLQQQKPAKKEKKKRKGDEEEKGKDTGDEPKTKRTLAEPPKVLHRRPK